MLCESQLIQSFVRFAGPVGNELSDDAYWDPERRQVLSTDLFIEGQHFDFGYLSPYEVGWKCFAGALSDIAAMGAEAQHVLVSLGIPVHADAANITSFYEGIRACQTALRPYSPNVVGGDTVASPVWVVNITVTGVLPAGQTPGFRNAAQPGDQVLMSGPHGLSAAGLWSLQHQSTEALGALSTEGQAALIRCRNAHRMPVPQLAKGRALAETMSRYSLMDSSDGLADALIKLAEGSGVRLEVEMSENLVDSALMSVAEQAQVSVQDWVLYGGEDYELVGTIPAYAAVPEGFIVIGRVLAGTPGAWIRHLSDRDAGAASLTQLTLAKTYHHFSA
ncbi:MAG: thiamine-phosphate kinase [Vampirovibrionales bacterium]|nr:thiamine-phosphate kinase [Vampirovibrionales bacterium]